MLIHTNLLGSGGIATHLTNKFYIDIKAKFFILIMLTTLRALSVVIYMSCHTNILRDPLPLSGITNGVSIVQNPCSVIQ